MQLQRPDLFREQCYLNGRWVDADDGATFAVHNPSQRALLGHAPSMGKGETARAIEAASHAFPAWSQKTAEERGRILRRWYELMLEHLETLATLMTLEQGKPLAEARGEIRYAASFLEWFSEEGKRIYGDLIPAPLPHQRIFVLKQPIGVACAITPWNFPAAMITRKCAPALAVGCTMVVRPSQLTPFSALALAKLSEEAGVPPGVFNVITGRASPIGEEMTRNPLVRKFSFTGSTDVGKLLMAQSASTVKKISLELGGSAPFLVFDDADLPQAIEGLIASKFRNAGQTCISTDRVLVDEKIYAPFAEALLKRMKQLKVGDGFEPGVDIGPLIQEKALEKVERHIADALAKGAKLAYGGKAHPLGGSFFEPTLLTHVSPEMEISCEETFGPVIPLLSFKTEEEALRLANSTRYGLAAYFYTQSLERMWRVAERLEFGMVSVNGGLFSNEVAPFGGVKESGIGREGSKYGAEEYLQLKYLSLTSSK